MRRQGFTLLEVMAVVVLLGIIASATAWSLAQDAARAQSVGLAQRLEAFDRMSRLLAIRHDAPVRMMIDLDGRRLSRQMGQEDQWVESGHDLRWGSKLRVTRVLLASGWREADAGVLAIRVDRGLVQVPVSRAGRSVSYALEISVPGGDDQDPPPRWLVICGLSGQMVWMNDEGEIEQLLQSVAAHGLEPD